MKTLETSTPDSLGAATGSALIGECDTCGNITAIDLDDTPEHWKEMQHPGRTVKRLPKDEALALWRERGRRCDHKALIEELRARVAPNSYSPLGAGSLRNQERQTTMEKSLDVTSVADAQQGKVSDIKVVGNGDTFRLLCKASSKEQGWMKSAKAAEIEGVGCIVQVTTQQGENVAEALTFVPGVRIVDDENGGRKLVKA